MERNTSEYLTVGERKKKKKPTAQSWDLLAQEGKTDAFPGVELLTG